MKKKRKNLEWLGCLLAFLWLPLGMANAGIIYISSAITNVIPNCNPPPTWTASRGWTANNEGWAIETNDYGQTFLLEANELSPSVPKNMLDYENFSAVLTVGSTSVNSWLLNGLIGGTNTTFSSAEGATITSLGLSYNPDPCGYNSTNNTITWTSTGTNVLLVIGTGSAMTEPANGSYTVPGTLPIPTVFSLEALGQNYGVVPNTATTNTTAAANITTNVSNVKITKTTVDHWGANDFNAAGTTQVGPGPQPNQTVAVRIQATVANITTNTTLTIFQKNGTQSTPISNLPVTNPLDATVNISQPGTYTVTINNLGSGCGNTWGEDFTVQQLNPPTITKTSGAGLNNNQSWGPVYYTIKNPNPNGTLEIGDWDGNNYDTLPTSDAPVWGSPENKSGIWLSTNTSETFTDYQSSMKLEAVVRANGELSSSAASDTQEILVGTPTIPTLNTVYYNDTNINIVYGPAASGTTGNEIIQAIVGKSANLAGNLNWPILSAGGTVAITLGGFKVGSQYIITSLGNAQQLCTESPTQVGNVAMPVGTPFTATQTSYELVAQAGVGGGNPVTTEVMPVSNTGNIVPSGTSYASAGTTQGYATITGFVPGQNYTITTWGNGTELCTSPSGNNIAQAGSPFTATQTTYYIKQGTGSAGAATTTSIENEPTECISTNATTLNLAGGKGTIQLNGNTAGENRLSGTWGGNPMGWYDRVIQLQTAPDGWLQIGGTTFNGTTSGNNAAVELRTRFDVAPILHQIVGTNQDGSINLQLWSRTKGAQLTVQKYTSSGSTTLGVWNSPKTVTVAPTDVIFVDASKAKYNPAAEITVQPTKWGTITTNQCDGTITIHPSWAMDTLSLDGTEIANSANYPNWVITNITVAVAPGQHTITGNIYDVNTWTDMPVSETFTMPTRTIVDPAFVFNDGSGPNTITNKGSYYSKTQGNITVAIETLVPGNQLLIDGLAANEDYNPTYETITINTSNLKGNTIIPIDWAFSSTGNTCTPYEYQADIILQRTSGVMAEIPPSDPITAQCLQLEPNGLQIPWNLYTWP